MKSREGSSATLGSTQAWPSAGSGAALLAAIFRLGRTGRVRVESGDASQIGDPSSGAADDIRERRDVASPPALPAAAPLLGAHQAGREGPPQPCGDLPRRRRAESGRRREGNIAPAHVESRKTIPAVRAAAAALLLCCGLAVAGAAQAQVGEPRCRAPDVYRNGKCVPAPPACPPPSTTAANGMCCPAGQVVTASGVCCPLGQAPQNGLCAACPANTTPTPEGCCTNKQLTNTGDCCPSGQTPMPDGTCCPNSELTKTGACCTSGQTQMPDGTCCPNSQVLSGQIWSTNVSVQPFCCPVGYTSVAGSAAHPSPLCCMNGQLLPNGQCCPPDQISNGAACVQQPASGCGWNMAQTAAYGPFSGGCCLIAQMNYWGLCCPPGFTPQDGTCGPSVQVCPPGSTPQNGTCVCLALGSSGQSGACPLPQIERRCRPGETYRDGQCVATPACPPPNTTPMANGSCCPAGQVVTSTGVCCPPGQEQGPGGGCVPKCMSGWIRASNGQCCLFSQLTTAGVCCSQGQAPQPNGTCCPLGQEQGPQGGCVPKCMGGWARASNGQCCPALQLTATGVCCSQGQAPQPNGMCAPRSSQPQIERRCRPGETGCGPTPAASSSTAAECAAGYAPTADNQCCLASQLTKTGACCAWGLAPQPDGSCARSPIVGAPGGVVPAPGPIIGAPGGGGVPAGGCGPGAIIRDGRCVAAPVTITKPPTVFRPPWRYGPRFTVRRRFAPVPRATIGAHRRRPTFGGKASPWFH
jgi:hypothetical protein